MKKLLIIYLILTCHILTNAQNVIYFSLQPCDLGMGLRYDRDIIKDCGAYFSATRGHYNLGEDQQIKIHNKLATGITYKAFTLGISHHEYKRISGEFNKRSLNPYSFEFGMRANINRFCVAITFDFYKIEGVWNFGIKF